MTLIEDVLKSDSFKVSVKAAVKAIMTEEEFANGMASVLSESILPTDDFKLGVKPAVRAIIQEELAPQGLIRVACNAAGIIEEDVV